MSKYSEDKLNQIWEKATIVNESEKNVWRKDHAGAWISKAQYGQETGYGWEVDHAKPESKGGSDHINNLVPLQWRNNRTKGDDYPEFKTSVTSDGNKNIDKEHPWKYK